MAFLGGPNQDIKVANAVGGLGLSTDVNGNGDLTDEDNNNTIYSITDQHVPISILENKSISINGTDVDLGGSISLEVATAGDYLSKSGDTLNVNLGTGLQGDGSDNITLTNDSITINGSSVALGDSISLSTGVDLGDDEKGTFGTDNDFSVRYDSTADSLIWQDGTNTADRMELDRSTGNLDIEGELTEGAAL